MIFRLFLLLGSLFAALALVYLLVKEEDDEIANSRKSFVNDRINGGFGCPDLSGNTGNNGGFGYLVTQDIDDLQAYDNRAFLKLMAAIEADLNSDRKQPDVDIGELFVAALKEEVENNRKARHNQGILLSHG